jgi:hypothetical protein
LRVGIDRAIDAFRIEIAVVSANEVCDMQHVVQQ